VREGAKRVDSKRIKTLRELDEIFKLYPLPWTDCADDQDCCGDLKDATGDVLGELFYANVGKIIVGAVNALPALLNAAEYVEQYKQQLIEAQAEIDAWCILTGRLTGNHEQCLGMMIQLQVLADLLTEDDSRNAGREGWKADLAAAQKREKRLRRMIRDLLLSADCTWEERNEGHDWAEMCQAARKLLEGSGE
jgi:hypothetical protein